MNHNPTSSPLFIAKRSRSEIYSSILIYFSFANLIWGYDYSLIFPNITYASNVIYWIGLFAISITLCNGVFIFLTPKYKIDAEYLYLYISFLEFKKILRSEIEHIDEITGIWNRKGVKFVLKSGREIRYFPYKQILLHELYRSHKP